MVVAGMPLLQSYPSLHAIADKIYDEYLQHNSFSVLVLRVSVLLQATNQAKKFIVLSISCEERGGGGGGLFEIWGACVSQSYAGGANRSWTQIIMGGHNGRYG
jgi:hypothetical protein